nr:hypothetical protein [Tanacetum cinerariifolium]
MSQAQLSSQLLAVDVLVPVTFQVPIGKCNSKADLNALPCSKSCRIIGEILKKHPLKDALTLSAPSPTIYMQQFWYAVHRAPDEKEVIRFKIDQHEVDFTLDMFRTALLDELVPVTFQVPTGKCNSKADLNALPCSKSCRIIGEILKKHPLKDALTLSAPSPTTYMQQFWYTVHRAPDEKEVIRFKIDQHEVDFTLDMFRTALRLPNQNQKNHLINHLNS